VELPSPDEFEERFKNLESRVGNTQQRRAEEKKQADRKLHSDAQAAKGAGVGLTIAYAILGLPMMGALIGYLIDKELGTNLWKGILTLIGAVIGVTFAVVVANRRA
jgi:F0F1-type ATP synthase assembly protein I